MRIAEERDQLELVRRHDEIELEGTRIVSRGNRCASTNSKESSKHEVYLESELMCQRRTRIAEECKLSRWQVLARWKNLNSANWRERELGERELEGNASCVSSWSQDAGMINQNCRGTRIVSCWQVLVRWHDEKLELGRERDFAIWRFGGNAIWRETRIVSRAVQRNARWVSGWRWCASMKNWN